MLSHDSPRLILSVGLSCGSSNGLGRCFGGRYKASRSCIMQDLNT